VGNRSVNIAGNGIRAIVERKTKKKKTHPTPNKDEPIIFPDEAPVHKLRDKLPAEDEFREYKDSGKRTYAGAKNVIKLHLNKVVCGFLNSSRETRTLRLGVDDKNCLVNGFFLDPVEQDQIRKMISQSTREKIKPFHGIPATVAFELVDTPADEARQNKRLYIIAITVTGLCPYNANEFSRAVQYPEMAHKDGVAYMRGIAETFALTEENLETLCEGRRAADKKNNQ